MKVYTFQGLMKSATKVYIRTDPIYLQYDLLQLGYATPPPELPKSLDSRIFLTSYPGAC